LAREDEDFGQYLKSLRESKKLTQFGVASELGYETAQFISNWERGVSMPPIPVIKKIALMYGISEGDLKEKYIEQSLTLFEKSLRDKFEKQDRKAAK
jgi:transcriptional regulator with XRE-family HTH domain